MTAELSGTELRDRIVGEWRRERGAPKKKSNEGSEHLSALCCSYGAMRRLSPTYGIVKLQAISNRYKISIMDTIRPYWKGLTVGIILLVLGFIYDYLSQGIGFLSSLGIPITPSGIGSLTSAQIILQTIFTFIPYAILSPRLVSFWLAYLTGGLFGSYLLLYYAIIPLYPIGGVLVQALFRRQGFTINIIKGLVVIAYLSLLGYGGFQAVQAYDRLEFFDIKEQAVDIIKIAGLQEKLETRPRSSGYGDVQYHISYFNKELTPFLWQDEKELGREIAELYIIKYSSSDELHSDTKRIISEPIYGPDGNTVVRKRLSASERYQNVFIGSQSDTEIFTEALWIYSSSKGNFLVWPRSSDRELLEKLIREYSKVYTPQSLE